MKMILGNQSIRMFTAERSSGKSDKTLRAPHSSIVMTTMYSCRCALPAESSQSVSVYHFSSFILIKSRLTRYLHYSHNSNTVECQTFILNQIATSPDWNVGELLSVRCLRIIRMFRGNCARGAHVQIGALI